MRKSGFTIPELLIVMVIMGLLLGIGIPNFKAQRDQLDFNQSVSRILEIIKAARNYALTSRATTLANGNKEIPREGYGVYFEKVSGTLTLTLFANTGTDNKETYEKDTNADIIEETYSLPTLTTLPVLTGTFSNPTPGTETTSNLLILFRPPLGEVTLTNNLVSIDKNYKKYNDFSLELESPAGKRVTIKMNAIGGFPEVQFE